MELCPLVESLPQVSEFRYRLVWASRMVSARLSEMVSVTEMVSGYRYQLGSVSACDWGWVYPCASEMA